MPQKLSAARALIFSLAVFTSAFLLFQVQPVLGKYVLPWFGGTPAVWTTCMLFFQSLLFGGYLYASSLPQATRLRRHSNKHARAPGAGGLSAVWRDAAPRGNFGVAVAPRALAWAATHRVNST